MNEEFDLAVFGGGVAALWLTQLAAARGARTLLLTAGPPGSHASTRSQGWLHSGAYYAAHQAWALARACAQGSSDVRALAERTPGLLVAPHKGLFLARDDEHADEVAVRLASAHIAYFTECTSWGRPGFVVIDAAVDTRLMVAKLLDDCRDVGATIVAGAIEHPPASDGGKWVIDTTYGRFRAGQVVLGLGAAMHKYLHAWRLDVGAPEYRATRTQVLVVPEAPMRTAMIPLFDAGPTLVPVWHEGRHHGVTVCLPFDNDDDPTHPARQSTAELLDQCVDRLPELARWLTRSVRESAWTYSCQKLLIAGQSDGTEASRTYRIDRLTDNLTAIYAGKLTTASTAARALLEELPLPNCPRARQPGELLGQPVVAPRAAVSRAFADQI